MQQVSAVPLAYNLSSHLLGRIFSLSCQKTVKSGLCKALYNVKFHNLDSDQSCRVSAHCSHC